LRILDCESVDSTFTSLEIITGVHCNEIREFLINLDLNKIKEKANYNSSELNDEILNEFKSTFNPNLEYDYVCWFHLTRTYEDNDYEDGLLPINEVKNKIWDFLFNLIKDDLTEYQWLQFRKDFENETLNNPEANWRAYLYKINTAKSFPSPHGYLIKEVGLDEGKDHYLKHPEIVMHIGHAIQSTFNIDIINRFQTSTNPCIVKFRSKNTKLIYIADALYYLHNKLLNEQFTMNSNNCFDGVGKKIDHEDIIEIKYINI
jgi:hypothetical protein